MRGLRRNNRGNGPILYQSEIGERSWEQHFRGIQQELSHMKETMKGRAPVSMDALVQQSKSPFTAGVLHFPLLQSLECLRLKRSTEGKIL